MTTGSITYSNGNISYNAGDGVQALKNFSDFTTLTTTSGYCHTWPTYYPTYVDHTVYRESKFDTAFKIVEKLMDKGHIKELTVKEFTKLVKEIAETL